MIYLFDVDGTLTPSRQGIDKKFAVWFSKFCERESVYLVTGSDKPKTLEQIGPVIYNRCKGVYQCSGNEYWIKERLAWWTSQGIKAENLVLEPQSKDDLSHYAKATTDILYRFTHGLE